MITINLNQATFISDGNRFDDMNSCNACGADNSNDITIEDTLDSHICEASTKCKLCGHEDYWGYGYFASSEYLVGKAKKY